MSDGERVEVVVGRAIVEVSRLPERLGGMRSVQVAARSSTQTTFTTLLVGTPSDAELLALSILEISGSRFGLRCAECGKTPDDCTCHDDPEDWDTIFGPA